MATVTPFRLTLRDRAILGELADTTVLSTELVHRRHFSDDATGKSCLRRLRYLANAKLVAPVEVTACFGPRSARHTVYRLLPFGADVVAQERGVPVRLLKTDPKADTLLHRISVARVMLALSDGAATAAMPKPVWLLEHDRWPDAARDVPEPHQYRLASDFLPVAINPNRPIDQYGPPIYDDPAVQLVKVRPDSACLLTIGPATPPIALFCEVDLGTETHGQLLSKLPGYHAFLSKGSWVKPWAGLTDCRAMVPRVLFIFASAVRRDNVIGQLSSDPTALWRKPYNYRPNSEDSDSAGTFLEQYFRFGVIDDVDHPQILTKHIWQTLRRRTANQQLAIAARPTTS